MFPIPERWLALAATCFVMLCLFLFFSAVHARDLDGRYAASPLKEWFDGLRSGKGPCCSDADGSAISDADWMVKDGHYRVRIPDKAVPGDPMTWFDVPDDAVITEPNRTELARRWCGQCMDTWERPSAVSCPEL